MKYKVILRNYLKHMSLQYSNYNVSLFSVNNIENNLAIFYWVNNIDRFHNNEGGE